MKPGNPDLSLRDYALAVTAEVRRYLPDVRAVRAGSAIAWTHGKSLATIKPAGPLLWELTITTNGKVDCRVYPDRTDTDTAHVAASNIVSHFEPRWCRGIDAEPYSVADMKRFEVKRSFVT